MKISIALATYNGSRYLQEQLDSFINQTRQPDELVVCDDGSIDDTIKILRRFALQAPFEVRVFENSKNLGYTQNFNLAMQKSTGDLIFLSDQDDVWFSDKIACVKYFFSKSPDMNILIHNAYMVDEQLRFHGQTKFEQIMGSLGSEDRMVTGALTVFRAKMKACALPIPKNIKGHDRWLHDIGRAMGARVVWGETLQVMRRHSSAETYSVANSSRPLRRSAVFLRQVRSNVAPTYQARIEYAECLRRQAESLDRGMVDPELFSKFLTGLNAERLALQSREALVRGGFFERKIRASSMLLGGRYKYFNGWKSFLRDVLR